MPTQTADDLRTPRGLVHVLVPAGIDDPHRPSGGNGYDRRVCNGLITLGWRVQEHPLTGGWPQPDAAALAELAGVIADIPDGEGVLIDGLIASPAPEVLVPGARRLRLVVLLHMPLGAPPPDDQRSQQERAVLCAAAAVITTSEWTRQRVIDRYVLPAGRVQVAAPGVEAAELAPGTAAGDQLLCVATVTPNKGHDVLLGALSKVSELAWRCSCVGSLTRDPEFADRSLRQVTASGIGARVRFIGPRTGRELDAAYAGADVLLLASRSETYGMVVTEALARGIPVISTDVGGIPEAIGRAADGARPGLLVPPGDASAFASAVRDWLTDTALRDRLRRAARDRRTTLTDWLLTSRQISAVLAAVTG